MAQAAEGEAVVTTACAWCLDPGCSGRPCRHTEALYAPPSAGLWKPPAAACLVCRRPYVSTRAARASAWTVGDEERDAWLSGDCQERGATMRYEASASRTGAA